MKLVGEYELTDQGVRIVGQIRDTHIHEVRQLLKPFKTARIYRGEIQVPGQVYHVPPLGYRPLSVRESANMLTVTALFTKNDGEPATGLTLAEIDLYLYRRTKADGTRSTIWSAQHPTEEIGRGLYSKSYTLDDLSFYSYFGSAQYTGATVLDSNYSLYGGIDEADKTGYSLAATGLDSIAVTAPTGVATTFPGMVVQLFRRFFGKVTMTATALKTWDDTGLVVTTTQTINDDGTTQTQGEAS